MFRECKLSVPQVKKRFFFLSYWKHIEANGQQVHLHISPIGYNHTVCRLWESWNFNEWCLSSIHTSLSRWSECGAGFMQTAFANTFHGLFLPNRCWTGGVCHIGWLEVCEDVYWITRKKEDDCMWSFFDRQLIRQPEFNRRSKLYISENTKNWFQVQLYPIWVCIT